MGHLIRIEDVLGMYKSEFHGRLALGKHAKWFPFVRSPSLAGIVADLMGDGHLQGYPKWRCDFSSKNRKELRRFGSEIFKNFGIRTKIRPCTANPWGTSYLCGVNCKPLGRLLYLAGVPDGCKVKRRFLIPGWIVDDKECFRRFSTRLFDCEGCVCTDARNSFIALSMWKAENLSDNGAAFFKQIKEGMKRHFDVETTNVFSRKKLNMRKDGTKVREFRIHIKRLESLINFYQHVGFDSQVKQNKLKHVLMNKGWDGPATGW